MSAEQDNKEKVSADIAKAFDDSTAESDAPEVLELEDTVDQVLRREKDGKPVARVYDCPTYDSKAYYSVRDEQHHFFFLEKGYPIDNSILLELDESGVEKVFIGLKREKSVLEFNLSQYLDRDVFNKGHGDQRCAPQDNAVRVWPNAVGTLLDEE